MDDINKEALLSDILRRDINEFSKKIPYTIEKERRDGKPIMVGFLTIGYNSDNDWDIFSSNFSGNYALQKKITDLASGIEPTPFPVFIKNLEEKLSEFGRYHLVSTDTPAEQGPENISDEEALEKALQKLNTDTISMEELKKLDEQVHHMVVQNKEEPVLSDEEAEQLANKKREKELKNYKGGSVMKINSSTIVIDKESEEYRELESLLSKLAGSNNISDVEEIRIALDRESGTVRFKVSDEDKKEEQKKKDDECDKSCDEPAPSPGEKD